MLLLPLLACTAGLAAAVAAVPASNALHRVYTFADGSFLENIAVRANGHLIFTSITQPRVYTIDPTLSVPTPRVLVEFNASVATIVSGITEYEPDRFAFIAARFDPQTYTTEGAALWSIDLHHSTTQPLTPRKITDLPDVKFGNGLIALPKFPGTVLISDSILGALWTVNVHSGAKHIVAQIDAFAASNPAIPVPLGINGIRTHGSDLYFVNTNLQRISRVPIHADGRLAGNVTVLASPLTSAGQVTFDDFAVDRAGRAWVATDFDALDVVLPSGKVVVAASGLNPNPPPQTAGPTSAAFGRGSKRQEHTLYVTTAFGILYALDTSKVRV
ncbi:hypothetical protein BKA62DRAFT_701407 [Auriculariales sp. MPI-PUGE-AT-0066]|nr:hypothetical protein BKA62DRAFT_701407 [Auriculariales sp. MPI-PUGE-AT-0066]